MDTAAKRIWEMTLPVLENTVSRASYVGMIESLLPVALQNNTLVLETPIVENRVMLEERYSRTFEDAIRQATGREHSVRFILPAERADYEAAPGSGIITLNPKYTFDTFVIGSSNRFFVHDDIVPVTRLVGHLLKVSKHQMLDDVIIELL